MAQDETRYLSRQEIVDIVREGVREGIHDAFENVGIDMTTAEGRMQARRNNEFLNDWRQMCELVKNKGLGTVIGTLATAALIALGIGIAHWFRSLGGS